ncbi:MAG: hypothetical protein ACSHX0_01270 [Akkermansiaceae bacterium]
MTQPDSISIESLSQFHELLSEACVDVFWFVRCEIGPDWIGSSREVQLLHSGKPLSGPFSDKLILAIISAANIPSESSDSVISGEGEILLRDEKLILDFEWSDTVPYAISHESGHGTVELDGSVLD